MTREHGAFEPSQTSKLFDNAHFGYRRIIVQRPLRLRFQITQEAKEQFLDACPELLDAVLAMEEAFGLDPHYDWNVVWTEVQRIVKVGYEINFNREFFKYQPPRPLAEIDAELEAVESRIMGMLREVTE